MEMKPITKFVTHTGETVTGDKLQEALNHVADFYHQLAIDIYNSGDYASHVSDQTKLNNMNRDIELSENIRNGLRCNNFTVMQRINTYLTGECVALLP